MPKDDPIPILIIEDDPQDVTLIRELLDHHAPGSFSLTWKEDLDQGIQATASDRFQLALLDTGLPDSQGPASISTFITKAPQVPVVVITGTDDEEFGIKLVQMGAQDYLVKGKLDGPLLIRTIRYALERRLLWEALENRRRQKRTDRELASIEDIRSFDIQSTTARLLGQAPLSTSLPTEFQSLCSRYSEFVELNFEERIYQVDHQLSKAMRDFSAQLGFLRAGPRDVVEIHTQVMREKVKPMKRQKASLFVSESKIVLIEILGHLVSYYRPYAISGPMAASGSDPRHTNEGS